MSATLSTPVQTPQKSSFANEAVLSTPLFVPPTPMLKELGYGTGVHVYRIDRSPLPGKSLSPWVIKRLRGKKTADNSVISSRLVAEANILRSLNHPNIVGFRGTKTLPENQVILAMETCDTSLGDLIEQREELSAGPLEPTKLRKLSMDICNALDYLHTSALILHGDIKSYNVLIKNSFEHCKLCDFGVSLPLNADGFVDVEKDPQAQYVGTELYSAPEVFASPPQDISSKCDIFSFGLVIFECLTLRVPHYEQFDAINTGMLKGNASYQSIGRISQQRQSKRLFDDSITDSKENISSITLNDSQQADNSVFIKSTAATIGDDTIQDITGTTFNGTINSEMNVSTFADDSMRQPMRDVSASLNASAFEADADTSMADKSDLSYNCSMDAIEACYGTRPLIPDVHNFSDEYNVYLETFFMCTHAEPDDRPAAGDLLKSFNALQPHY